VHEAFGGCDVLVNNAGVPGGGEFVRLTYEQIERVVRVNLLGVMYGTRAFWPAMLEQGRGHVVNVASLAGRFAAPGASVYTATKHAVVAFSEALYYEGEPHGVLVTAVNPGLVATEGFPQDHVPRRLVMKPERVAAAIVRAVQEGIAPELAVPRWLSPLEAFRVLTPPLYRWGVRKMREVGVRATQARR
jgi:short-subunit dehydrogenase